MPNKHALVILELPKIRLNTTWALGKVLVEVIVIGLIVVVGAHLHSLLGRLETDGRVGFPVGGELRTPVDARFIDLDGCRVHPWRHRVENDALVAVAIFAVLAWPSYCSSQ